MSREYRALECRYCVYQPRMVYSVTLPVQGFSQIITRLQGLYQMGSDDLMVHRSLIDHFQLKWQIKH